MAKDNITLNTILMRLQQRVSQPNARLLLETVRVQAGIVSNLEQELGDQQAKDICLKLISQGGPSFQVGQAIYKEYFM